MLLGIFFAGASDNLQLGIQATRSENDVEVGRVGGSGSDQPARPLDMRFAQRLFLGRVAHQHQPVLAIASCLRVIVLHNDELHRPARQLATRAASHASRATNDVVVGEPVDFPFHFSPAKKMRSSNSSKACVSAPMPRNTSETPV